MQVAGPHKSFHTFLSVVLCTSVDSRTTRGDQNMQSPHVKAVFLEMSPEFGCDDCGKSILLKKNKGNTQCSSM